MTASSGTHAARLDRARVALREADVDLLVVGPGADLFWLTGFELRVSERPSVLLVTADGPTHFVTPGFEVPIAARDGVGALAELHGWEDGDDAWKLVAELVSPARIAVSDVLPAFWTLALRDAFPDAPIEDAARTLRPLRMVKDDAERQALSDAGAAIDAVHAQVAGLLRPGRTEDEVAAEIASLIAADHDAVGFVIVGSGPNGAIPHHDHGPRELEQGDMVVVDIGGPRNGYWSDCTRTYAIGEPSDPDAHRVHTIVEEAQRLAFEAVRPGVTTASIDAVARDHIAAAGYGEWFSHRTGHGIGTQGHEDPYLVRGSEVVIEPGMSFSIEPGVYLPDRFGVRVEDIVIATDDGAISCNGRPHGLTIA